MLSNSRRKQSKLRYSASIVVATAFISANCSYADCPPRGSAFKDLEPLRLAECANGETNRELRNVRVVTDDTSLYFFKNEQVVEFSTSYSLDNQVITARAEIDGAPARVDPPSGEQAPYAIIDDLEGKHAFLIGQGTDYQLEISTILKNIPSSDWVESKPKIQIERGHRYFWLTALDRRVEEPARPFNYPFLAPIYCGDFNFAVKLPELKRIALIAGTRVIILSNDKAFQFNGSLVPKEGFKEVRRTSSEEVLAKSVDGNRFIGSVATAAEATTLWLRLMETQSEGDEGRAHYFALETKSDGTIEWSYPVDRTDSPAFWCHLVP